MFMTNLITLPTLLLTVLPNLTDVGAAVVPFAVCRLHVCTFGSASTTAVCNAVCYEAFEAVKRLQCLIKREL